MSENPTTKRIRVKKPYTGKKLRVTLVKSTIGCPTVQKRTVKALGLLRLNATIEHPDNPSVRGMIFQVKHLLRVEEA